jgi:hypothetical protein
MITLSKQEILEMKAIAISLIDPNTRNLTNEDNLITLIWRLI